MSKLDMSKLRNKLNTLRNVNTRSSNLWKPEPGTHTVRIVPYTHDKTNPFIELFFHYNLGPRKTFISPMSFGRPDPVVEFARKLQSTGVKEDWIQGKKLEPKMRTYVPILVRGKESEGVKFWGFGKQLYEELLAIIADPDYGDITDLVNGRDITVTIKTAEETGKSFPETTIRVKPKETPATNDLEIMQLIENAPHIKDSWPEPSYTELNSHFTMYLSSTTEEQDVEEVSQEINKSDVKNKALEEFDDLFNNK